MDTKQRTKVLMIIVLIIWSIVMLAKITFNQYMIRQQLDRIENQLK